MRKQYVRYDENGIIVPMSLSNVTPTRKMVGDYGYKSIDELRQLEYPRKALRAFLRVSQRGRYSSVIVAKTAPRSYGRFIEIPYSLSGAIEPVSIIEESEIIVSPSGLEGVTPLDIEAGESITFTFEVPDWSIGEVGQLSVINALSNLPTIVLVADPSDPYKDNQQELNELGISATYTEGTWTIVFDEELSMQVAQNQESPNISFLLEILDTHGRVMHEGESYYNYKVNDVTPEPEPEPE